MGLWLQQDSYDPIKSKLQNKNVAGKEDTNKELKELIVLLLCPNCGTAMGIVMMSNCTLKSTTIPSLMLVQFVMQYCNAASLWNK